MENRPPFIEIFNAKRTEAARGRAASIKAANPTMTREQQVRLEDHLFVDLLVQDSLALVNPTALSTPEVRVAVDPLSPNVQKALTEFYKYQPPIELSAVEQQQKRIDMQAREAGIGDLVEKLTRTLIVHGIADPNLLNSISMGFYINIMQSNLPNKSSDKSEGAKDPFVVSLDQVLNTKQSDGVSKKYSILWAGGHVGTPDSVEDSGQLGNRRAVVVDDEINHKEAFLFTDKELDVIACIISGMVETKVIQERLALGKRVINDRIRIIAQKLNLEIPNVYFTTKDRTKIGVECLSNGLIKFLE